jgi:hypothetical protein
MPVLSYGSPQGLFMTLKSLRRLIMDARNFLKVKNFKIKEGSYTFEDVKYLCVSIITSPIRLSHKRFEVEDYSKV